MRRQHRGWRVQGGDLFVEDDGKKSICVILSPATVAVTLIKSRPLRKRLPAPALHFVDVTCRAGRPTLYSDSSQTLFGAGVEVGTYCPRNHRISPECTASRNCARRYWNIGQMKRHQTTRLPSSGSNSRGNTSRMAPLRRPPPRSRSGCRDIGRAGVIERREAGTPPAASSKVELTARSLIGCVMAPPLYNFVLFYCPTIILTVPCQARLHAEVTRLTEIHQFPDGTIVETLRTYAPSNFSIVTLPVSGDRRRQIRSAGRRSASEAACGR